MHLVPAFLAITVASMRLMLPTVLLVLLLLMLLLLLLLLLQLLHLLLLKLLLEQDLLPVQLKALCVPFQGGQPPSLKVLRTLKSFAKSGLPIGHHSFNTYLQMKKDLANLPRPQSVQ